MKIKLSHCNEQSLQNLVVLLPISLDKRPTVIGTMTVELWKAQDIVRQQEQTAPTICMTSYELFNNTFFHHLSYLDIDQTVILYMYPGLGVMLSRTSRFLQKVRERTTPRAWL